MESLMSSSSFPNSFQLRLGLKCRKNPSFLYIRTHARFIDRRIRCASAGSEADGVEKTNTWESKDFSSSGDAFAGWVGGDSGNGGSEKKNKTWFGGFVGAGVAGVILAAGLTLTYSSLSKRNSGSQRKMEPLTTQQDVLIASDDQNDQVEQVGSENNVHKPSDCNPESETGIINKDSSSSQEVNDASFESRHGDYIDEGTSLLPNVESLSNSIDDVNNASSTEESQISSEFSDEIFPPYSSHSSRNIPESDRVHVSADASSLKDPEANPDPGMPESTTKLEENLVPVYLDSSSVTDADSMNLKLDYQEGIPVPGEIENTKPITEYSSGFGAHIPDESVTLDSSVMLEVDAVPSPHGESKVILKTETSLAIKGDDNLSNMGQVPTEDTSFPVEEPTLNENGSSETTTPTIVANPYANEPDMTTEIDGSSSFFESLMPENSISPAGIPAPSLVSAALQVPPGKVVVPAIVDQVQGHALAALQLLKVIEADVKPTDLCTRREYARWLVYASGALSKNPVSKVYPAMYIENVTELAFDDITPQDPDFTSIQGLAEAGLISSKLSRRDMVQSEDGESDSFLFLPESPLSRQDLVSWKMAVDKKQLPEVDRKIAYQRCGFIDIDRIDPDAWPALVADRSAGEQGIITLAFGYTRLFQPDKPVTNAQAAIALATGEGADIVSEELARIEAESMAETAVAAHTALLAQVEKDINASFERELAAEREKIDAIEKMAQEARSELESLRAEREHEDLTLAKERADIESELEVLSRLRRELEEQLQSLMSNKVEISFEKERINQLRKEAESENQVIARLQYELDVERKALSMARAWAEDEAKRAREQAKSLEEARDRWERHGIKVVVDDDLREDANVGVTWLTAGKQSTVEQTVGRAESLASKLKEMAAQVRGKSKVVIEKIILKITSLIYRLKAWAAETTRQAGELQGSVVSKAGKIQDSVVSKAAQLQGAVVSKASGSVQVLQQSTIGLSLSLKEGAKRIAEDCREGVEKISQKFKA